MSIYKKLRKLLKPAFYRWVMPAYLGIYHQLLILKLQRQNSATIVFIVSELSQWKYQSIYDVLAKDKRFHIKIVLVPYPSDSQITQKRALDRLRQFFNNQNIDYVDFESYSSTSIVIKSVIKADIIFYPQPYENCYASCLDSRFFEKKLICYFPYGMPTIRDSWTYNLRFHNIAWRIYYQTTANDQDFRTFSFIKGRNVKVVGDPIADQFLSPQRSDVWKEQDKKKLRIIWAPHYSIRGNKTGLLSRNSFEWLSDAMLQIASDYQDIVQFSFKPHPRLLSELYQSERWGYKNADDYYNLWRNMPNTQIDTGDYVDLFKTSDALIHDCASFTAEYQFTENPVLFLSKDLEAQQSQLTAFGKKALKCHYIGNCVHDIRSFIDSVVIGGNDPLKKNRIDFRDNFLLPPGGLSSADNVYNDIVSSIGFKQ